MSRRSKKGAKAPENPPGDGGKPEPVPDAPDATTSPPDDESPPDGEAQSDDTPTHAPSGDASDAPPPEPPSEDTPPAPSDDVTPADKPTDGGSNEPDGDDEDEDEIPPHDPLEAYSDEPFSAAELSRLEEALRDCGATAPRIAEIREDIDEDPRVLRYLTARMKEVDPRTITVADLDPPPRGMTWIRPIQSAVFVGEPTRRVRIGCLGLATREQLKNIGDLVEVLK